jgi:hypothetical protein
MKKYQLKERALILFVYAFMKREFEETKKEEGIDLINSRLEEFTNYFDIKIMSLFKKLERLNKIFSTKRIADFLLTRVEKKAFLDKKRWYDVKPLYASLIVLYWYLKANYKKDIVITEIKPDEIKKIVEEQQKDYGLPYDTLDFAEYTFTHLYPDLQGYIEFLKLSNVFPYSLFNNKKNSKRRSIND